MMGAACSGSAWRSVREMQCIPAGMTQAGSRVGSMAPWRWLKSRSSRAKIAAFSATGQAVVRGSDVSKPQYTCIALGATNSA